MQEKKKNPEDKTNACQNNKKRKEDILAYHSLHALLAIQSECIYKVHHI